MKCIVKYLAALLVAAIPLSSTAALACTGVYVGKDASDQGTIIIARSEDQAWGDVNKRYMVQERMENVPRPLPGGQRDRIPPSSARDHL